MSFFRKKKKDTSNTLGSLIGNELSKNAQRATEGSFEDMTNLLSKASKLKNVSFEQGKGNLFEYIEAAKFNADAALKGVNAKAIVTDIYDSGAAADILIKDNGKTVKEIQAKFIKTTAKDGHDNSAASSVMHMTGAHNKGWGQYEGMEKLVRKQEDYNSNGSLLDEAKKLAGERSKSSFDHKDVYEDIHDTLTDETSYKDASSGGTTIEETKQAFDNPNNYAKEFSKKQRNIEMKTTAVNMAKAGALTSGIISGAVNLFELYRDEKELDEAIADVTKNVVNGGVRGAATGVLSTSIRYKGLSTGNSLLSDSVSATVMASGLIDGGVSLYRYAKGEIDGKELCEELGETTIKSTATIFYTKAINSIVGHAANPLLPFAIYTSASYIFSATKSIIKNANLKANEYRRMSELLNESSKALDLYKEKLKSQLEQVEDYNRGILNDFLDNFDYNINTGENYDKALDSIVQFANRAGFELKDTNLDNFVKKIDDENYIFILGDFDD